MAGRNCGDSAELSPQYQRSLEDAVLARVVANVVADGNCNRDCGDADNGSDRRPGDDLQHAAGHLIEFDIRQ